MRVIIQQKLSELHTYLIVSTVRKTPFHEIPDTPACDLWTSVGKCTRVYWHTGVCCFNSEFGHQKERRKMKENDYLSTLHPPQPQIAMSVVELDEV